MSAVRILADDLTGALDTAGCFANPGSGLPVVFDAAHLPETESFAVSTGSRDIPESEVAERMERFLHVFDTHDGIAFKKIDSLLRGHVAAEIAHLVRRADFHSVVIAPAFPAFDRITRNGRQWAKLAGDDRQRMVGPDLRSDFARFGIDLRLGLPDAAQAGSPQVFMADAQTDGDLKAIVDSCRRAGRLLWCGSAGLADSLVGGARRGPVRLAAKRMLVICGTRHPVASLQLERLGAKDRSGVLSIQPGDDAEKAIGFVNDRLRSGTWTALSVDFPQMYPEEARASFATLAKKILPKLDRPDVLFVMGGDTLQLCCDVLGARELTVRGLLVPGIPVSEFHDGDWKGLTVVSKSGAFGPAETLCDVLAMADAGADVPSPLARPKQKVSNL
jgi:D-threonate/D-erythronate kinase